MIIRSRAKYSFILTLLAGFVLIVVWYRHNSSEQALLRRDLHRIGAWFALEDLNDANGSKREVICEIDLKGPRFTDSDLVLVGKCTDLETLVLENTKITGSGFDHLKSLSRLTFVSWKGRISDSELFNLLPLKQLKTIAIASDEITDEGVATLAKLTSLKSVTLYCPKLTDRSVQELLTLPNIRYVGFPKSHLSQQALDLILDDDRVEEWDIGDGICHRPLARPTL